VKTNWRRTYLFAMPITLVGMMLLTTVVACAPPPSAAPTVAPATATAPRLPQWHPLRRLYQLLQRRRLWQLCRLQRRLLWRSPPLTSL